MNNGTTRSGPFRLRVWGDNACFTRPEMKAERVSYDVMTPSAARGVMEAILWKPGMQWRITRLDVLNPIRWASVRRNEVSAKASTHTVNFFIEEKRQQRAGLILRDVAYIIHSCIELTSEAGMTDSIVKFQEMFLRRAENGQCFTMPYLGCREFTASFELVKMKDPLPLALAETRDLGWMLHDMDFSCSPPRPRFFRAVMEEGVIQVPELESQEVRR